MRRALVTASLVAIAVSSGLAAGLALALVGYALLDLDETANPAWGRAVRVSWLPFTVLFCWLLLRTRPAPPRPDDPARRAAWDHNQPPPAT